jgi:hypothetical protein
MAINTTDESQAAGWVLRIDDPSGNAGLEPQLCAQGGFLCQTTNGQGLFSRGNWTHLVFTIAPNGGTPSNPTLSYTLYVDGAQKFTTSFAGTKIGPPPGETTPLLVGGISSNEMTFRGVMDEIAFWDCVLSPSDVTELHSRKFAWAPP